MFLDIKYDSLPPADHFPTRVLNAAKTCRLGIVVLSRDCLSSKWPMLELSAFRDAGVQILPLFYLLSPSDLSPELVCELQKKWEDIDSQSPGRINIPKWTRAVEELRVLHGLVLQESEGHLAYTIRIRSAICKILPPSIKFAPSADIQGQERLCERIIDEFHKMESSKKMVGSRKLCVLGMHGPAGSGKSTLSKCLMDELFTFYAGKVLYIELPENPTKQQLVSKFKELFKLTDYSYDETELSQFKELSQVVSHLGHRNVGSSRVFLVIDIISCDKHSTRFVDTILLLNNIIGEGSRVLLVARTLDILHFFHRHVSQYIRVPSIDEKEAVKVLSVGLGMPGLEEGLPRHLKDALYQIVGMCLVHDQQQSLYCPSDLEDIAHLLRRCGMDLKLWERQWQKLGANMQNFEKKYQNMIVDETFITSRENLKRLFCEVASFLVSYFVKLTKSPTHYGKRRSDSICADAQKKPFLIKFYKVKTALSISYLELEEDYKVFLTQIAESWKQGGSTSKLKPSQHMLEKWDEGHVYGPSENQGMKNLLDISVYCPQLSKEFEVLQGHFYIHLQLIDDLRKRKPRMLRKASLLISCWELKDFFLCFFSCMNGMDIILVVTIWLKVAFYGTPGFASSVQYWFKLLVVFKNCKFQCMKFSYQLACLADQSLVESTGLDEFSYKWDCANLWKLTSPDNSSDVVERPTCPYEHAEASFLRVLTGCKLPMLPVLCNMTIRRLISMKGKLECQRNFIPISLNIQACNTIQLGPLNNLGRLLQKLTEGHQFLHRLHQLPKSLVQKLTEECQTVQCHRLRRRTRGFLFLFPASWRAYAAISYIIMLTKNRGVPKRGVPKKRVVQLWQVTAPFVEAFGWLCIYCIQATTYLVAKSFLLLSCGSLFILAGNFLVRCGEFVRSALRQSKLPHQTITHTHTLTPEQ